MTSIGIDVTTELVCRPTEVADEPGRPAERDLRAAPGEFGLSTECGLGRHSAEQVAAGLVGRPRAGTCGLTALRSAGPTR
ncbi:hypothetical protein IU433_00365 [Nocardia puris]|uniref:Uncharacterized protein n=1 Tax=Nocardia puris TaxID=208602 RepID=A0A366DU96_9NOCA|nr:hypothetical protein [Nocardia puris]MBF6210239.1 hypothetical protein [Nocardia puris]MBF6367315.1 hypothetical protein [Nocardia puris]MBF6457500.1 hypothetical protein [Nocardia puris]RBO93657.1 hypothetical protein DFR74_10273 [Nocardia puris]